MFVRSNTDTQGYAREIAGGSIDPRTGYLYMKTGMDYQGADLEDARANTINNLNNSTSVQFLIWDPATGRYVDSRPVQPQSLQQRSWYFMKNSAWYQGHREDYSSRYKNDFILGHIIKANASISIEIPYRAYRPIQGLSITANGDILLLVTTGNRYFKDRSRSNEDILNNTVVRITPKRDADGNYALVGPQTGTDVNSPTSGWTYSVVTKIHDTPQSDYFTQEGAMSVGAFIKGRFVSFGLPWGFYRQQGGEKIDPQGYNEMSHCAAVGQDGINNCTPYYPSAMLVSDLHTQKTSSVTATNIVDPSNDPDTDISAVATQPYSGASERHNNGMTYHDDGQPFAFSSFSSPLTADVISGTVYWDSQQNGKDIVSASSDASGQNILVDTQNAPRVEGETVALYDSKGNLIESTKTDRFGQYAFYITHNENDDAEYYVRLVQPQVGLQWKDSSSTNPLRPVQVDLPNATVQNAKAWVVSLYKTPGDPESGRLTSVSENSKSGAINALQTWALVSATLTQDREKIDSSTGNTSWESRELRLTPRGTNNQSYVRAACYAGTAPTYPINGAPHSGDELYDDLYEYQNCWGAEKLPYTEKPVKLTPPLSPDSAWFNENMPVHSSVNLNNDQEMTAFHAQMDFAIASPKTSWGDAAGAFLANRYGSNTSQSGQPTDPGSETVTAKAPYFSWIDPHSLHLGKLSGDNQGDLDPLETINLKTDDGVWPDYGNFLGYKPGSYYKRNSEPTEYDYHQASQLIPSRNRLNVRITGYPGSKYRVVGWLSDRAETDNGISSWLQRATDKNFIFDETGTLSSTSETIHPSWHFTKRGTTDQPLEPGVYILRVMVMDPSITTKSPDDTKGDYDNPTYNEENPASKSWVNPGEIEDYQMTIESEQPGEVRIENMVEKPRTGADVSSKLPLKFFYMYKYGSGTENLYSMYAGLNNQNELNQWLDKWMTTRNLNPSTQNQYPESFPFNLQNRVVSMQFPKAIYYDTKYQQSGTTSSGNAYTHQGLTCFKKVVNTDGERILDSNLQPDSPVQDPNQPDTGGCGITSSSRSKYQISRKVQQLRAVCHTRSQSRLFTSSISCRLPVAQFHGA